MNTKKVCFKILLRDNVPGHPEALVEICSEISVVSMPADTAHILHLWIKAKLPSPVQLLKHWMCDVQSAIAMERTGPFLLTSASCRHCSFWCILSVCWAYFSDVTVLLGFRKLQWIRCAAGYQIVTMALFWSKFDLGSALKLFLSPSTELVVTSCHIKSTVRHSSQFH